MTLEPFPAVRNQSPQEKPLFVSEFWKKLEANPGDVPGSQETISEPDHRVKHVRQ